MTFQSDSRQNAKTTLTHWQVAGRASDGRVSNRIQFRLSHLFVATTVLAAIMMWVASWRTSYELHGAVGSASVIFFGGLFLMVSLFFLAFRRLRIFTCIVIVCVSSFFGVRDAVYAKRLRDLKTEVSHIAAFIDQHKAKYGKVPSDLSAYAYHQPELQQYIEYNAYSLGSIRFHPFRYTGVSHWWYPDSGYYFEDD